MADLKYDDMHKIPHCHEILVLTIPTSFLIHKDEHFRYFLKKDQKMVAIRNQVLLMFERCLKKLKIIFV